MTATPHSSLDHIAVSRHHRRRHLPHRGVPRVTHIGLLAARGRHPCEQPSGDAVDRVQVRLFPVITGETGLAPIVGGAADFDLELIEHRMLDVRLLQRPLVDRGGDRPGES